MRRLLLASLVAVSLVVACSRQERVGTVECVTTIGSGEPSCTEGEAFRSTGRAVVDGEWVGAGIGLLAFGGTALVVRRYRRPPSN